MDLIGLVDCQHMLCQSRQKVWTNNTDVRDAEFDISTRRQLNSTHFHTHTHIQPCKRHDHLIWVKYIVTSLDPISGRWIILVCLDFIPAKEQKCASTSHYFTRILCWVSVVRKRVVRSRWQVKQLNMFFFFFFKRRILANFTSMNLPKNMIL